MRRATNTAWAAPAAAASTAAWGVPWGRALAITALGAAVALAGCARQPTPPVAAAPASTPPAAAPQAAAPVTPGALVAPEPFAAPAAPPHPQQAQRSSSPAVPPESAAPQAAAPAPPPPTPEQPAEDLATREARLRQELPHWIRHGGVATAVDGNLQFVYRPGRYTPASIIKLATALTALHVLGPGYRFRTEVYLDARNNLYVRGYGDPYLVSESWQDIARRLEELGVFDLRLNHLVLDDSAFAPNQTIDGVERSLNPYDARLGALVTNFNTAYVRVGRHGHVESAEPQTPLTPLARQLGRRLPRGPQRINLSRNPANILRYTGEVARAVFAQHGGRFRGGTLHGVVPKRVPLVLVHRSERTLVEMIDGLLEFSNNFIANQFAMVMALERTGPPAHLAQGVAIERDYLEHGLGLSPDSFHLEEASGISHNNWVDLSAMVRITDAFYPWRNLLKVHDVPGMPPVLAKTGTLSDVHSLAGFFPAPPGERHSFVIMLNQTAHTREQVLHDLLDTFGNSVPDSAAMAP